MNIATIISCSLLLGVISIYGADDEKNRFQKFFNTSNSSNSSSNSSNNSSGSNISTSDSTSNEKTLIVVRGLDKGKLLMSFWERARGKNVKEGERDKILQQCYAKLEAKNDNIKRFKKQAIFIDFGHHIIDVTQYKRLYGEIPINEAMERVKYSKF